MLLSRRGLSLARLVADSFLFLDFASVAALKVKDGSEIDWDDVGDVHMQRHGNKNLRDRWRRLRMNAEEELGGEGSHEITHARELFSVAR